MKDTEVILANVYLGPEGSETVLPRLEAIGDSLPAWPVSTDKQAEKAKMSDGSYRWAFFGTKKVFEIAYGNLSSTQLETLKALNELNQVLRFKNEYEEDVWYDVVISRFSNEPERMDIRQLERYRVTMTLEEV